MKNENVEDNASENKVKKLPFLDNMSKSEKILWGSISIFMFVYIVISIIALNRQSISIHQKDSFKEPIIKDFIQQIVPSPIAFNNMIDNENNIITSLNYELNGTYQSVDETIDDLFDPINSNVDEFLDYHYSVIGEYTELGAMAFGDIDKMIADKLFGENFSQKVKDSSLAIDKQYKLSLQNHLTKIHDYAIKDIDIHINNDSLERLKNDIDSHVIQQELKVAAVGAVIGVKIAAVISAKIATKAAAKGVGKAGSKLAAKSAAAGTGAAAGVFCGPFVWICSPVAAGVLWIATDVIVVTGDEYITRDKFKKEIIKSLDESKLKLKNSYKDFYYQSLQELSDNTVQSYKEAPLKEKRMVKEKF